MDNEVDSDDDEENAASDVNQSHSNELIQPFESLVVTEQQIRCDCNTKCKTKRCPCVGFNKSKCTSLCHLKNSNCENK